VSSTGVSIRPNSSMRDRPAVVPAPLNTKQPASTGAPYQSSPGGRMAVTPVRTGPSPIRSGPSPWMRVTWPTRTPGTSVMALSGPGGSAPMATPASRARGCVALPPTCIASPILSGGCPFSSGARPALRSTAYDAGHLGHERR
jgi:hypothetical protein